LDGADRIAFGAFCGAATIFWCLISAYLVRHWRRSGDTL
jgi:hypothetical protein